MGFFKNFILFALSLTLLLSNFACSKDLASRELFVIHIHGDWCKTCNKIDNVIHSAEDYFNSNERVTYVVFDETNPETIESSRQIAEEFGLAGLFEYERHTGELLFVDKNTRRILTRYYGVSDRQQYIDTTEKILDGIKVPDIDKHRTSYDLSKPPVDEIKGAKLYVIDVHHDKCGGCSATTPVFEALAKEYLDDRNVSFFTFDLTTRESIDQSRTVASRLGLKEIYDAQKHTGEVLFVDALSKTIVNRLVTETDKSKYRTIIDKFFLALR